MALFCQAPREMILYKFQIYANQQCQEPMIKPPYALHRWVNVCANLSIFRTNPSAVVSHLHQFTSFCTIWVHCFQVLSSFDNNLIMIGHPKQCVQIRRTRGVLKIERYAQRLTHRACTGEASSNSWSPNNVCGGGIPVYIYLGTDIYTNEISTNQGLMSCVFDSWFLFCHRGVCSSSRDVWCDWLATLAKNKRQNNWNNDLDLKTIEAALQYQTIAE